MGICASDVADPEEKDDFENEPLKQEENKDYSVIAETLKDIPLLANLSDTDRQTLGSKLEEKTYVDGDIIMTQGEPGYEFFLITEGCCAVLREDDGKTNKIAELSIGDYFGESALINNDARSASIKALGSVVCLTLSHTVFSQMFGKKDIKKHFVKRTAISAEAYGDNKEDKVRSTKPANAITDKDEDTLELIEDAVENNPLFAILTPEQRQYIFNEMWLVDVKKGEKIIVQGDLGDHFYVVHKGFFEIYVGETTQVSSGGKGFSFGTLAIIYKQPRAATVIATKFSQVWAIDRWTFRQFRTQAAEKKIAHYDQLMKKVFPWMLSAERRKIAESLEEISYAGNSQIFAQGDKGETFFIVESGGVSITQEDEKGESKELVRYGPNKFFGELSLIKSAPRAATATATVDSKLLYLTMSDFKLLLGNVAAEVFQKRMESYNKTGNNEQEETDEVDEKEKLIDEAPVENYLVDIKLESLQVVGTLGRGSFGHVQLVKDAENNSYALKKVSKVQVVELSQQEHIISEKRVMAQLNSPFLVKLYATYRDPESIYFLLEPALGGELFTILRSKVNFNPITARFYAACVIEGFAYMHERGIIYRDLKPENLLLANNGYLKITDFGFAKKIGNNPSARTWTLCGTPEYLAPEIVAGLGHGKAVDWWTLGILIYEMIASYPPYYGDTQIATFTKIMNGDLTFPKTFQKSSKDIIKKLLQPKATKRLGVTSGGVQAIRKHAFFKYFNWQQFQEQKMSAPIQVAIRDNLDLSNFDPEEEDDEVFPPYDGGDDDWDAEF